MKSESGSSPHQVLLPTTSVPAPHLTDLQRQRRLIRERDEFENLRVQDLNHTFATDVVMRGEILPLVGMILNHT